ncbi:MAG: hypothetical protein KID07_06185 [Firmicutes bacterium]|nr:hypothetical protein [Bacillota bacterium]
MAKLSVSEILPIEDKKADLSTAATRQSQAAVFAVGRQTRREKPEGEA